MANAIVKLKIMPSSPEADLEKIQEEVRTLLDEDEEENIKFEKQPIAFGLNALFFTFMWPEEKDLEGLEEKLKQIENVRSVEVVDMRRAIG
jgi:elongation factor 1-beta